MRKFIIILLFTLTVPSISSAQRYYRCVVDSVAVRVAGGERADTFYVATPYYDCEPGFVMLRRGNIVWSKGATEKGFTKIYNPVNTLCWDEGWVKPEVLSPATLCPACKGKGTTGELCTECDGQGDWPCCHFKGELLCKRCGGAGYY